MIQSKRQHNYLLSIVSIVIVSYCLNVAAASCVHTFTTDESTRHNCPHCPPAEDEGCHDQVECYNCDRDLVAYESKASERIHDKLKDIPFLVNNKYIPQARLYDSDSPILIYTHSSVLPLYLRHCAFLN